MSNLPTQYDPNFWGNMDSSDFKIPSVKIGQPQSKKIEPGKFNFSSGEVFDRLENVKLLGPHKTRVLYGKTWNSPSRCGSDDYYTPSPRIRNPISQSCLNCFAAQWGEDDERKQALHKELDVKTKLYNPLCKETYNPMMVDGTGRPFTISFQGTMLKIVSEKLLTKLKVGFRGIPPYLVAFNMGIFVPSNIENKVHTVKFENFRRVEGEEAELMQQLYESFGKNVRHVVAEQVAQMDAHAEREVGEDTVPF